MDMAAAGEFSKTMNPSAQSRFLILLAAFAVAAYLSFSPAVFNDPDTSWHLAAGEFILRSGAVPDTDPFSFTFAGSPWIAHEWFAELIMACAFRMGSWGGLALLTGAALFALVLTVGAELEARLPAQRAIAVLAALLLVLAPSILARPHVLAWPLLASWVVVLMKARRAERAPPLAATLLMLAWANLHGSFVLGLVLAGAFGLEALLGSANRKQAFLDWAVFGAASLAASLMTPHGLGGLFFPLQLTAMDSLSLIDEWRPTSLAQDKPFLAVTAGVGVLLLFVRPKISPVRLVVLAALLFMALAHARHQTVLAIVGTLLLAEAVLPSSRSARSGVPSPALILAACSGWALLAAGRLALPVERGNTSAYPVSAIQSVPPEIRRLPVFNSYNFGGPLILNNIRPFIDGRADMYGNAFMFEHRAARVQEAAFGRIVEKWNIRWTILHPEEPLVKLLDQKGWRRTHSDSWAVVQVAP